MSAFQTVVGESKENSRGNKEVQFKQQTPDLSDLSTSFYDNISTDWLVHLNNKKQPQKPHILLSLHDPQDTIPEETDVGRWPIAREIYTRVRKKEEEERNRWFHDWETS